MLLDGIKSFQSSAFFDRFVNHDCDVDGYHDGDADDHGEAELVLSHVVLVESCEAHVMVDLDQTEYVVDVADGVVALQNESGRAIEVDEVEDSDQEPCL